MSVYDFFPPKLFENFSMVSQKNCSFHVSLWFVLSMLKKCLKENEIKNFLMNYKEMSFGDERSRSSVSQIANSFLIILRWRNLARPQRREKSNEEFFSSTETFFVSKSNKCLLWAFRNFCPFSSSSSY